MSHSRDVIHLSYLGVLAYESQVTSEDARFRSLTAKVETIQEPRDIVGLFAFWLPLEAPDATQSPGLPAW